MYKPLSIINPSLLGGSPWRLNPVRPGKRANRHIWERGLQSVGMDSASPSKPGRVTITAHMWSMASVGLGMEQQSGTPETRMSGQS